MNMTKRRVFLSNDVSYRSGCVIVTLLKIKTNMAAVSSGNCGQRSKTIVKRLCYNQRSIV